MHVLWHGGEPMTLPANWFRSAATILDRHIPGRSESMQTSLIPYRSEYASLIHERFNGGIGSSVDFSQRKFSGSVEKYLDVWMRKVELARREGVVVIPGTVPTVAEIDRAEFTIDWFVERGFPGFNVDRYNDYGIPSIDRPSNAQHSAFLWSLFQGVMRRFAEGTLLRVNVVSAVLGGVLYDTPGDRWGGTCQSDFVVIEPDGSLNSCPDRARFEPSFSHIGQGAEGFLESPLRRKWVRLQTIGHANNYCDDCENATWCKTGCPLTSNNPAAEGDCAGYKQFITQVRAWCRAPSNRELADLYLEMTGGQLPGYVFSS